jgi:hypothetical protein
MIRSILAGIVGIVVAFGIVVANETLGHMMFPPQEGIDFTDPEVVRPYLASLPAWKLLQVMAGWVIGVFAGILVAAWIGRTRVLAYTVIIGGLMLAATISNLIIIPHPMWFNVTSLGAIALGAWLAKSIAEQRVDRTPLE